jgi:hypothetical protein
LHAPGVIRGIAATQTGMPHATASESAQGYARQLVSTIGPCQDQLGLTQSPPAVLKFPLPQRTLRGRE